jgi:hypothetical protein
MAHKFLAGLLMTAILIAMVANGALAAGRAASHAGGIAGAVPPCHHVTDAGVLAPLAVNSCDTLCGGAVPEFTLDHPPSPDPFPDISGAACAAAISQAQACRAGAMAEPVQDHPPPTSPYQRDRRLLI